MFEWQSEYLLALKLVSEAANVFLPAFFAKNSFTFKTSSTDLVTETDKAIEKLLFEQIRKSYPHHSFIGEEGLSDKTVFDNRATWIIDPIDGTTNFVHKNVNTCISIGFSVNKIMQFGVVFNPITNNLFTGRKGYGSTLNGKQICVSGEVSFNKALLSTCTGASRAREKMNIKFQNFKRLCSDPFPCHGIRMLGSAVLMICHVAAGYTDAFWECGLAIWDMAAASVILTEAGGVVVSPKSGETFDFTKRRIIAASTNELVAVLQSKIDHIDYPANIQSV